MLSQAVGYGVVIGIGFFFALVMVGVSYLQVRWTRAVPRGRSTDGTLL